MDCSVVRTGVVTTLEAVRSNRPMLLEFWHRRCNRCPAGLMKLDKLAAIGAPLTLAACAIAVSPDDATELERVVELHDAFPHLTHLFMTFEQKERAKRVFGFSSVPYCVLFDAGGLPIYSGPPGEALEQHLAAFL